MLESFPRSRSHARYRCQQRATPRQLYMVFQAYADAAAHVGNRAVAVSISRQTAREMRADGIASDLIDRARRRAIVELDGTPLTLIAGRERSGRHYFRNRPRSQSEKRARRRR